MKSLIEVQAGLNKEDTALLKNALALGEENDDILFIDKKECDSPLFIFNHDGADIEKTKLSVSDIIKKIKPAL